MSALNPESQCLDLPFGKRDNSLLPIGALAQLRAAHALLFARVVHDIDRSHLDIIKESRDSLRDLDLVGLRVHLECIFLKRLAGSGSFLRNHHGIDDIVFMFTANPGEDSKSLAATASGGEASRIMLAIKCILSYADTVPTLIFDEIDTGVSGKASAAIANKLHMLARDHQVLCVTHTSQIAAASDNNFLISKNSAEDSTSATVTRLDEEKKILEVSRLLSGTVSDESVDLAKKLVEEFS